MLTGAAAVSKRGGRKLIGARSHQRSARQRSERVGAETMRAQIVRMLRRIKKFQGADAANGGPAPHAHSCW